MNCHWGTHNIIEDNSRWFFVNLLIDEFLNCTKMFQTAPEVDHKIKLKKYTQENCGQFFGKISLFPNLSQTMS